MKLGLGLERSSLTILCLVLVMMFCSFSATAFATHAQEESEGKDVDRVNVGTGELDMLDKVGEVKAADGLKVDYTAFNNDIPCHVADDTKIQVPFFSLTVHGPDNFRLEGIIRGNTWSVRSATFEDADSGKIVEVKPKQVGREFSLEFHWDPPAAPEKAVGTLRVEYVSSPGVGRQEPTTVTGILGIAIYEG